MAREIPVLRCGKHNTSGTPNKMGGSASLCFTKRCELALEVVQIDNCDISKPPKQTYMHERNLRSHKGFEFADFLNKPSSEGPSHASIRQATTTQPVPQQLTVLAEGPPPTSGAVRKQSKGLRILPLATAHKKGQPVWASKSAEVLQLTPEETEFIEAQGENTPVQFSLSASPRSEASISLDSLAPLPPRYTRREQLPPTTPHMPQPEDTVHEVLEHLTHLEVQSSTVGPFEKELLEAQQQQTTATGECAGATEDFNYTELLAELKDLRLVHLCQLVHHEADIMCQKWVEKKVWEELRDLKGAVENLNVFISTQCVSIANTISTQGSAITQAIKDLTAVVEQMAFASTTQIGEETASSRSTVGAGDTHSMPSGYIAHFTGMHKQCSGSTPGKKGRGCNK